MKNSGRAPGVSYKFRNQAKSFGSLNNIFKVFWIVTPCSLVEIHQNFGAETSTPPTTRWCKQTVRYYWMSVNVHLTARRHIPEGTSILHSHLRHNVTSYIIHQL